MTLLEGGPSSSSYPCLSSTSGFFSPSSASPLPSSSSANLSPFSTPLYHLEASEGTPGFLQAYRSGVVKQGDGLPLHWRHRSHILELQSGGARDRRHDEWFDGLRYSASAVTGIPIHCLTEEHLLEAIKYQGRNSKSYKLDLEQAIQTWNIWSSIEDNIQKTLIAHIQELFSSQTFALIMVDSGMTHRTLQLLKSIDEFNLFKNVTSTNVTKRLKVI